LNGTIGLLLPVDALQAREEGFFSPVASLSLYLPYTQKANTIHTHGLPPDENTEGTSPASGLG